MKKPGFSPSLIKIFSDKKPGFSTFIAEIVRITKHMIL
ncbi:Uncharacterized protein dnm_003360 [Desulfonema magnum]|uniref:Uncharacterized protein n=1 Tax=Desulfonema magnum TaxID=45655 RepID=A0A975GK81_9BACT|nr:Uncharacterized protein dnm_003360 [Desulfonema magnum]